MRVGIIGAGNMGSGFARCIAKAGHDVLLTSRDLARAEKIADQIGLKVKAIPHAELGNRADILIAATPAPQSLQAIRNCGDIRGKIIIDIANPINADFSGLTVGLSTSFAEELAKSLPEVKVVKAFNTVFAQVLHETSKFDRSNRATTYYCGDDEEAKKSVRQLIEGMGFEAIDSGPLSNARYLEPMAMLIIWLGYSGDRGTDIFFNLASRTELAARHARAA